MPTLLVVDDIAGVHEMLDLVFEDSNIDLVHALLGPQALEIYQSQPVDVVLSDIQMPGMDGLELFKQLKQLDPAATVVLTTVSESRDYVIQALRLGAFDYVEKPYHERELILTIKRALIERKRRLAIASGLSADQEAIDLLKKELSQRDAAIAQVKKKDAEIEHLKTQLSSQKELLNASEQKRKELDRQHMELEVREGALKTMDAVLQERMAKLKATRQQNSSGLTQQDADKLTALQARLEARETELLEMEAGIRERELFISQTEESLMEKSMRLQEIEAELEQLREDIMRGSSTGSISPEAQEEIEAMKEKLAAKEASLHELEEQMKDKERSIRKAEALIKAREQFLAQSEAILLGGEEKS